MDQRILKLAQNLINHSCRLKKGEKVLIESKGSSPKDLVKALIREAYQVGALPFVVTKDESIQREILKNSTKDQIKMMAKYELKKMKDMDAYIGIGGNDNTAELSDVSEDKLKLYSELFVGPVHLKERVNNTKWVVLRYPNNSMAQLANTSLEAFEDFYFDVCCLDYSKMEKAMEPLTNLLSKTDKVRILGNGTDISFSIKGLPNMKCYGLRNIPDGEVYTAPVKDSVNGIIKYNVPSLHQGFTYENIVLEFKNGKIIKATSNDNKKINEVLDTDDGARYIGEFAIGVNPYILHPMNDILFDEKIAGSIHFTPGQAYKAAYNGNDSSIHWDLVLIQRAEYGGGEIWFDDQLIRKDGIFILDELKVLNPENLK